MSRILIVDDDTDILKFCDALLTPKGHEVLLASDPYKALDILETHPVDLLVVDVMMPLMSGFDLLKRVRGLPHLRAPILMLTRRSTPRDVKTAIQLGATDYMIKPFDADVFVAKVKSLLSGPTTAQEVKFASSSTYANAEITYPAVITSISEMGISLLSVSYMDRSTRLKITSPLFDEVGVEPPALRVTACTPVANNEDYHYEVFVSFIGLDEQSMRKIRQWISNRAIATRKAS